MEAATNWRKHFPTLGGFEQRMQVLGNMQGLGKRFEGHLMGFTLGIDINKAGAKQQQRQEAPPPPQLLLPARDIAQQEEKIYNVKGTVVTTTYNLRLELTLEANGETMEFKADVAGIFTASANPLRGARLRSKDVQALRSRGTLFYFYFRPTRFEICFYDPNNTDAPLGELQADSLSPAGNPGSGSGKWTSAF